MGWRVSTRSPVFERKGILWPIQGEDGKKETSIVQVEVMYRRRVLRNTSTGVILGVYNNCGKHFTFSESFL